MTLDQPIAENDKTEANFKAVPNSVFYRGRARRTKLKSFRKTYANQRRLDAAKGVLVQEIADRANITRGTSNNKLCALRKAGKIGRRPQNPSSERQRIAEERAALVEKYRKQGLTNDEIAAKVKISTPRVWQIVQVLIAKRRIDARINRFQ